MKADATWESRASETVLLVRVLVGLVFLSEGILTCYGKGFTGKF
jgi:hypothetical protein